MINFKGIKRHRAKAGGLSSMPFWLLIALLLVLVALGGSSRGNFWGILVIRPLALLVACLGAWTLTREQIRAHRFLFALLGSAMVLTALELIPLPYGIWSNLPGRDIIVDIDRTVGLQRVVRPFTMSPSDTRNALYSMTIPLAVLILGVQLSAQQLRALLPFFIGFGVFSAGVACLQILSIVDAPLSWYQLTNDGTATGLFTNRNHQALLLCWLLPMFGLFAAAGGSETRLRPILCTLVGAFLLPLILLTGSRGGLVFAALCAPAGLLIFWITRAGTPHRQRSRRPVARYRKWLALGGLAFAVVLSATIWVTIASGRAETVSRFAAMDISDSLRQQTWGVVRQAIPAYLPLGSGIGSYEPVFSTLEPAAYLRPSYSNHAHNDWLEVAMTAGLPGMAWLAAGVIAFAVLVRSIILAARHGQRIGWNLLGLVILLTGGMSSIVDYPLRVPMMQALYVIACLWATLHLQAPRRCSRTPAGPVG